MLHESDPLHTAFELMAFQHSFSACAMQRLRLAHEVFSRAVICVSLYLILFSVAPLLLCTDGSPAPYTTLVYKLERDLSSLTVVKSICCSTGGVGVWRGAGPHSMHALHTTRIPGLLIPVELHQPSYATGRHPTD